MKTRIIISRIFLLILLAGVSEMVSGCILEGGTKGDGKVTRETRAVSAFDAIEVSGAFEVFIKQGEPNEVIVEADENLQKIIRAEVHGNTLVIDNLKPINHPTVMKVYITFKNIRKLDISGAVDLITESKITLDELSLHNSGAADIKMDLSTKKLDLDCSGASKLRLSGTATDITADLSGACEIGAFDLLCENINIELSGAGKAQLNVTKKFIAEISGAGSVQYKGNPTVIDKHVSGAGSIKHVD